VSVAPSGGPQHDVIVIGGGIIGCGIARDAALRGLKVALVEQRDFGSGTTAGSTRLIHGGLRYLQTGDFALVRLDLRERETLLRIAPHLVKPLPFLLPLPRRTFGRLRLRVGMHLYDALSYDKSLPSHRVLGPEALAKAEPALDASRFHGAALFYDAQCAFPERLALENVVDAHGHGAVVQNHTQVVGAVHDGGRLVGVRVKHLLEGGRESELRGRVIVNAGGPWFDRVAGVLEPEPEVRVRTTKGIHIACENVLQGHALVLESPIDGRVIFAIPWNGYTWVGTTDTDFEGDPAAAHATDDDIGYLLESAVPYLPALRTARKFWTTAGVRALVRSSGWASGVSRAHKVRQDVPGLLSVIGGKLTGYRAIAEEVTDLAAHQLAHAGRSSTARMVLPGGGTPQAWSSGHLHRLYGSRASAVENLAGTAAGLDERIVEESPDIVAQVIFAARHDWCRTVDDFMYRRSEMGLRPDRTLQAAPHVARWLAHELDWPAGRESEEVQAYRAHASRTLLPDGLDD
jgi:glycerol-3-phosphate dehydrogenase